MRAPLAALAIAVVALASAAAPAAGGGDGPILVADPDEPGPNLPPVGRSLFDEVYGVGPPAASPADEARHAIPFPFERLLADLNARIAPAEAKTVLVPLGRSLQRHAADPDYFASPRIVVAVDDDGAGAGGPLLRDRLYLGYHERAGVIEVISYNEDAGRFEFQVVEGYGPGRLPRVEYAERSICVTCHQGHAPIFATALWSETNADPRVAARLAAELGAAFHGAPVRRGIDVADALDRSTDRANRLAFANFAWTHGCGGPEGPEAAARCRGDLLLAVLRYRLGGARGA
ncbi:MAG TPA: hypothetical protein VFG47_16665, partial [Geminicoccaceae bacterium]|nr:hypothetical protein [Geminicoccaceae bacterium]